MSKSKTRLSQTKVAAFDAQVDAHAKAALGKLLTGTKRTLDAMRSSGAEGLINDDGDGTWGDMDDADDEPLDQHIELSAEGEEAKFLQEYICKPRHKATQTWVSRITTADLRWTEQLEALVDAYLKYKHEPIDTETLETDVFQLPYIDVFDSNETKPFHHISASLYTNATLLAQGTLGPTPTKVYVAFSLRTLELYWHVRIWQPRVSVQAWLHVICDMHNQPYRRVL
ncbi:hypothetical protein EWM64_g8656 [Hericium alpestre]|uniref:Uncharacterized protein n=1 Tax=Hericium alpestre TaxID=135208 RepID=A0A4Y9ZKL4_9AGAM|nr:hypothetical protein EWM64_g8656 [Hericium alpestre]